MTTVYVAAPLSEVDFARVLAAVLHASGYTVTSTWHSTVSAGQQEASDPRVRQDILAINLADLTRASVVVAWTGAGTPRGTYSEIGWALAHGRKVVWVQGERGEGANIFDADPGVVIVREHEVEAVVMAVREVVGSGLAQAA